MSRGDGPRRLRRPALRRAFFEGLGVEEPVVPPADL